MIHLVIDCTDADSATGDYTAYHKRTDAWADYRETCIGLIAEANGLDPESEEDEEELGNLFTEQAGDGHYEHGEGYVRFKPEVRIR